MGMGVFPAERTKKMPGAHKIGAAISGPRITGGNFMDTTLFLKNTNPLIPKIRPDSPPETKYEKNDEKKYETPEFRVFFVFFRISGTRSGVLGVRVAIYENPGFPNQGFRNL